jgi:RND family efflux transporter MFP subunit
MRGVFFFAVLALTAGILKAHAATTLTVQPELVPDEKAVFATVESRNVVPARARIPGTVVSLTVQDGDEVKQGQVIAQVVDEKLQLQLNSLDAQIAGLKSQLAEAQTDLARAEILAKQGAVSKQTLDQARTATEVAASSLRARIAERAVVAQQMTEGNVLAPTSGRVLEVPLTRGTVVMAGEPIAQIAEHNFVLRLRVPERQARFLKAGDKVRVDGTALGQKGDEFGTIVLVYPRIEEGRVLADVTAEGVGAYFVGQRVRVWIDVERRWSYRISRRMVIERLGLTYVRRRTESGVVDTPVQLGRDLPTPTMPDGVEVLSGLNPGDVLVVP